MGSGLSPGPQDIGAEDLIATGRIVGQAIDESERLERQRTITRAMSQLRLEAEQGFLEAQTNADNSPDGFVPRALKAFDDRRVAIAKGISDRDARHAFIDHADIALRNPFTERALQFEHEQGVSMRLTQAQESLTRTLASIDLNPDSWMDAGMEALRHIDSIGLTPAEETAARARATNSIHLAAALGYAKKDPRAALANLATTSSGNAAFDELGPEARGQVEQLAKSRLAEVTAQGVLKAYETDARTGTAALVALNDSGLPADVLTDARRLVREGAGLLHAERRQQYGDQVTALERAISRGAPGANAEAQAEQLYRRGAYTSEQRTNVLQAIDEARQRGAAAAAEITAVQEAFTSGARLDPRNEKVVKAVDAWFKQVTQLNGIAPGSDEWINSAAQVAHRTNILPPEAMSWARKTLLSGDPALSVPAANAISRWADASPTAYAYFDDPNLKAQAEGIDGLVRAGVAPAKAVEIVRANTFDIPKARQDALKATYTKEKYAASNDGELQSFLDGDDRFDRTVIGGAPAAPLAMRDEFSALVRTYFDATNGDIKRARELAWKDIRGVYGYSMVNGTPEILKYAPELIYSGLDAGVIRADIDAVAKASGVETPVKLTPSRMTGDTRGLLWQLQTTDADGNEEVLLDEKNRPLIYAIPTDTARYVEAQEALKRSAIEAARAESARRRQTAEAAASLDPLANEFLP